MLEYLAFGTSLGLTWVVGYTLVDLVLARIRDIEETLEMMKDSGRYYR